VIAITFALPVESSDFLRLIGTRTGRNQSDIATISGKIDHRAIEVLHTGVGRKACQANIDDFLRVEHPDFLISSGFAGGMREDLCAGDLFLAENFSDRQLLFSAQKILASRRTHSAKLFTSTAIIDSVTERNQVARKASAAAVDMETETIARACATRGIRMLSLRVISDSLHQPLPAPPGVLFDVERQKTDFGKLITHTFKHPAALWRLVVFAQRIAAARSELADALITLLRSDPRYT